MVLGLQLLQDSLFWVSINIIFWKLVLISNSVYGLKIFNPQNINPQSRPNVDKVGF